MAMLVAGTAPAASFPNPIKWLRSGKELVVSRALGLLGGSGCGVAWGDPQIEVGGPGARKIRCWFVMRDGTPAGLPDAGWFAYVDTNRDWYVARILEVTVRRGELFYTGPVLAASRPWWKKLWLHGAMLEGGGQPDRVWGKLAMEGPALWAVAGKNRPQPVFNLSAGGVSMRPH